MQGSIWAVLSELFTELLAALLGVTGEPPPITFELPAVDLAGGAAVACIEAEFGLSRGEGARDVACLARGGFVSVMATDGSGEARVSSTGLLFQSTGPAPAVADTDGDGWLDLVVLADTPEGFSDSSSLECQFAVLLGDGVGGFTLGPTRRLPHRCRALGSADVDEDGAPDFIAPYVDPESPTTLSATLLLSRPGGQFEIAQYREEPAVPASEAQAVEHVQVASDPVIFDANGDHHADILFVTSTVATEERSVPKGDALNALLGDGQGGFRAGIPQRLGMWGSKFSIAAADYDADGLTDVVVAVIRTPWGGPLELPRILLGSADGTFGPPVAIGTTEASADLHSADYDGDGHVDLITSGVEGPIHLYAGHGDGSFAAPIGLAVGREPWWISTLDYELDGNLDLVAMTAKGLERFPLPPRQGSLGAPRVYSFILQSFLQSGSLSTEIIDLDGDSDNDVVGITSVGLLAFSNEGPDGFRVLDIELFARDEQPYSATFALGDLNGDGRADVMHAKPSDLRVHLQRADGTWEPLPPIASANGEYSPQRVAFSDANADGRLDIIEAALGGSYSNLSIHVQDPEGRFSLLPTASFEADLVELRDVTADGCFDALANVWDFSGVLAGDCAGKFAFEHLVPVPPYSWSFEFADMNLDGRNDFIIQSGILLANSSGSFDRAATLPGDGSRVWVMDFNGDGLPDVGLTGDEFITLTGDGNGGVGAPQRVISSLSPDTESRLGDLIGDELPDAIFTRVYGAITGQDPHAPYQGPPGHLVELTVLENISAR